MVTEIFFPDSQDGIKVLVKMVHTQTYKNKKGIVREIGMCVQIEPQHKRPYIVLWRNAQGMVIHHIDSETREEAEAYFWSRVFAHDGKTSMCQQQWEDDLEYLARVGKLT